jgi:hypothetical protein
MSPTIRIRNTGIKKCEKPEIEKVFADYWNFSKFYTRSWYSNSNDKDSDPEHDIRNTWFSVKDWHPDPGKPKLNLKGQMKKSYVLKRWKFFLVGWSLLFKFKSPLWMVWEEIQAYFLSKVSTLFSSRTYKQLMKKSQDKDLPYVNWQNARNLRTIVLK